MSAQALAAAIRSEANIADRPGQYDRLNALADQVEALATPDATEVRGRYDAWSNAAEDHDREGEHDAAVALGDALRPYLRATDPEGNW